MCGDRPHIGSVGAMVNSPATVPQGTPLFVTVLAIVLTLSVTAPKAIAAPVDDLLAAPVSAGTLALLSAHTDDPRAVDRIAAGLTDARAEVRRAAARVVAGTG